MPEQRTFDAPAGALVVHTWEPVGPPTYLVLVAHGYAEHAGRYDHVAERLAESGARVVAPDQRGHGQSGGVRGRMLDMDSYAGDLLALADATRTGLPAVPQILIGHSMGGLIAARFAQLWPDRVDGLVLSAPVVGGNPEVFALADQDPIPDTPVDPTVLSRDPAVGAAFAGDPLVYRGPYQRETLAAYRSGVDRVAASGRLSAVPTLWIHGTADRLAPLEVTRPAIERIKGPRFETIIYPEARHELFNETNRDTVLTDLLEFLSRVLAGSPAGAT